jgi:UDP-glucose:(heptosyl)LPS alpha-1,3-glucosyltransferase
LKLVFCLFKVFPYGGLERDFLRIARLCHGRGHEVIVFTQEWQGDIPAGFKVHLVPFKRRSSHGRARQFVLDAARFLERERADAVIGFNKMPGLDLYYAADPCLQHRLRKKYGGLYQLNPRYRAFVALEESVFSAHSHAEIMLLAAREQEIFQRCYQTPAHRFHVLPPGISRDRIAPPNAAEMRENLRSELKLSRDDRMLLHIGSAFSGKGVDRILDAMAALPGGMKEKVRLIVLGEDDPRAYRRQARKLKLDARVNFLGGRDDVPRFLLGADLLVHPARSENTGTVLLEAIVSGLPVLATEACGYAFHIHAARAGRVVSDPFNQTELDRLLFEMLTSSEQKQWRKNALDYAKTTDLYSLPERAVELIEARARSSRQAAPGAS